MHATALRNMTTRKHAANVFGNKLGFFYGGTTDILTSDGPYAVMFGVGANQEPSSK
jgi:hypothetical protein